MSPCILAGSKTPSVPRPPEESSSSTSSEEDEEDEGEDIALPKRTVPQRPERSLLRPPKTLGTTMFDRLESMYGQKIKKMLDVQYRSVQFDP